MGTSLMGDIYQADGGIEFGDQGGGVQLYSATTSGFAGSWYELHASTEKNAVCLCLDIYVSDGFSGWIDIGIGGVGSEIPIIEKFRYDCAATKYIQNQVKIPISIPAGTRIVARHANSSGTANRYIYIHSRLYAASFNSPSPYQICDLIGRVNPPMGNISSYGNYIEIVPSLPSNYNALIFGYDDDDTGSYNSQTFKFTLALGETGFEVDIIKDLRIKIDSSTDNFLNAITATMPIYLPASERLSVKSATGSASTPDIHISVWGVR